MSRVVRGVLIPDDLPAEELYAYIARVKASNAEFCRAVHALEDEAASLGLTMEDLES